MARAKQNGYFHPRLKHSDRRFELKKQLPADFHCKKWQHRLAKGEDFYFSTEAGAGVVDGGIHTAVWLNIPIEKNTSGESRAICDSDGKLLFTQASDFILLSSKSRAQEVLSPCGTFVGTVSWDKAPELLKPPFRDALINVRLRAVFRKGDATAFDNCTQAMVLKPHRSRREVDDWLRELCPFVPSPPALRVEKQWPETIWEDAETLYSGWLHGQTWDLKGRRGQPSTTARASSNCPLKWRDK
ncbi:hypothetical protein DFJ77DRAFT_542850 [Powellomyces hirtus]|nr:hypothetical protein DFJ77DRAFT_542850 [Powellomyces hirtus]